MASDANGSVATIAMGCGSQDIAFVIRAAIMASVVFGPEAIGVMGSITQDVKSVVGNLC
jgi:hypothetical protein